MLREKRVSERLEALTWVKASLWEREGFLALKTVNCFFMYNMYREGSFLAAAAFLAGVVFLGVDFLVSLPAMIVDGVGVGVGGAVWFVRWGQKERDGGSLANGGGLLAYVCTRAEQPHLSRSV